METERRLMGDDGGLYTTVPYTTTDLSPYSSTSTTSAESSLNNSYYSEYDWHQNADAGRMYFPLHDRIEPAMHNIYNGYPQTSTDMYQPNAIWHPQPMETSPQTMIPTTSILPSFSRSSSQSSLSPTGPNSKSKRKRIQTQPQRKAANVRERKRMFHLNEAFDGLRLRLPAFNYEKRLSRIETLRLAITYIGFMKDVTDGKDPKDIKLAKNIHDIDDFAMPSDSTSSSKGPDSESE